MAKTGRPDRHCARCDAPGKLRASRVGDVCKRCFDDLPPHLRRLAKTKAGGATRAAARRQVDRAEAKPRAAEPKPEPVEGPCAGCRRLTTRVDPVDGRFRHSLCS